MTAPGPVEATAPRAAGIVSRGAAGIIDVLVVLVALSAIYVGWVFFLLAFSPRAFSFPTPSAIFSTLGFFPGGHRRIWPPAGSYRAAPRAQW